MKTVFNTRSNEEQATRMHNLISTYVESVRCQNICVVVAPSGYIYTIFSNCMGIEAIVVFTH